MLAENILYQSTPSTTPLFMAEDRPVSISWANSPSEKEAAFRIRYKVYCERLGFENTTNNPDQMEVDSYDGWSKHILVRDIMASEYIGTMRIVEPSNETQKIPLEHHFSGQYHSQALEPGRQAKGTYIEISRLAVNKLADGNCSKRYTAEVARLLYLTAFAYFQHASHLSHGYWLSEKWLSNRLNMFGFISKQIGTFAEYKGQRAPFLVEKTPDNSSSLDVNSHAPFDLKHTTKELYEKIVETGLFKPSPEKS